MSSFCSLQALHVHNNQLTSLPLELTSLSRLFVLVLAFNRFESLPEVVAAMTDVRVSEVENVIMAGNRVTSLPPETIAKLKYVKKLDLRMNQLSLPATETSRFTSFEHLTHMDLRNNVIEELDVRGVRTVEYLNVENNLITSLMVNGAQLKNLFAANNCTSLFLTLYTQCIGITRH